MSTPQDQRQTDLEHLRLLAVFHFVVAGFAALFALFPLIHLLMGLGLMTGAFAGEEPQAAFAGCFFVGFAGTFILAGLAMAGCLVAAGRFLQQQQRYMFCLVVAAVSCAFAPFGTVLGVFTIVVLMRTSVRKLFDVVDATEPDSEPDAQA